MTPWQEMLYLIEGRLFYPCMAIVLFVTILLALYLFAKRSENRRMRDYAFVQKYGIDLFRDMYGREPGE